jgi:hypothetical protein
MRSTFNKQLPGTLAHFGSGLISFAFGSGMAEQQPTKEKPGSVSIVRAAAIIAAGI